MTSRRDSTSATSGVDRVELPVACSLNAHQGAQRVGRWRALHDRALPAMQREPGRVLIRYPRLPGVEDELGQLVNAERECCAFAEWRLTADTDSVLLEVLASGDGLDALTMTLLEC